MFFPNETSTTYIKNTLLILLLNAYLFMCAVNMFNNNKKQIPLEIKKKKNKHAINILYK